MYSVRQKFGDHQMGSSSDPRSTIGGAHMDLDGRTIMWMSHSHLCVGMDTHLRCGNRVQYIYSRRSEIILHAPMIITSSDLTHKNSKRNCSISALLIQNLLISHSPNTSWPNKTSPRTPWKIPLILLLAFYVISSTCHCH